VTIQTPTRITIEIHPAESAFNAVVAAAPRVAVSEPRVETHVPATYEPDPCTCLDGDCRADHGNE
jgi:hypothetical protein